MTAALLNCIGLTIILSLLPIFAAHAEDANVAPLGIATQSSIDPANNFLGVAANAIDGNRDGNWADGSVSHTRNDDPPTGEGLYAWWEVTLDQPYLINGIIVFNRTDCCISRIEPFRLTILLGNSTVYSQNIATFIPDITGANISGMTFSSAQGVGDRVRVQLTHPDWLSLAEVEIYVSPVSELPVSSLLGAGLVCIAFAMRRRTKA
jgi:hypothetical protein